MIGPRTEGALPNPRSVDARVDPRGEVTRLFHHSDTRDARAATPPVFSDDELPPGMCGHRAPSSGRSGRASPVPSMAGSHPPAPPSPSLEAVDSLTSYHAPFTTRVLDFLFHTKQARRILVLSIFAVCAAITFAGLGPLSISICMSVAFGALLFGQLLPDMIVDGHTARHSDGAKNRFVNLFKALASPLGFSCGAILATVSLFFPPLWPIAAAALGCNVLGILVNYALTIHEIRHHQHIAKKGLFIAVAASIPVVLGLSIMGIHASMIAHSAIGAAIGSTLPAHTAGYIGQHLPAGLNFLQTSYAFVVQHAHQFLSSSFTVFLLFGTILSGLMLRIARNGNAEEIALAFEPDGIANHARAIAHTSAEEAKEAERLANQRDTDTNYSVNAAHAARAATHAAVASTQASIAAGAAVQARDAARDIRDAIGDDRNREHAQQLALAEAARNEAFAARNATIAARDKALRARDAAIVARDRGADTAVGARAVEDADTAARDALEQVLVALKARDQAVAVRNRIAPPPPDIRFTPIDHEGGQLSDDDDHDDLWS